MSPPREPKSTRHAAKDVPQEWVGVVDVTSCSVRKSLNTESNRDSGDVREKVETDMRRSVNHKICPDDPKF